MNTRYILQRYNDYVSTHYDSLSLHPTNTVVGNIYKRIILNEYIDYHIIDFQKIGLDNQFIKSIQAYLLLSSSDALGSGSSFYSFGSFLDTKKAKSIISEYENRNEKTESIIKKLLGEYESECSVKLSFMKFWNKRSDIIKRRIVLCYFPYKYLDWEGKYLEIIGNFYKSYRNPFTHRAISNFPPIYSNKSKQAYQVGQIIGIGFIDKRSDNKNVIDVPIFYDEAEEIISNAKYFFWVLDKGNSRKRMQIHDPQELMRLNADVCSYRNELDNQSYVHNGLLNVMTMAIIEGLDEYIENGDK